MNNWKPTTDLTMLKQRAKMLADIRQFFTQRNVLEVETPALSQAANSDPYIESII
jgi:lysyl-tRNA synthetase class 2